MKELHAERLFLKKRAGIAEGKNIFINNLPPTLDEDELSAALSVFGKIIRAEVGWGQRQKYGYVLFFFGKSNKFFRNLTAA